MTYHINYAYTCHMGRVRRNNEDNFWCCGTSMPAENHGMDDVAEGIQLQVKLPVFSVFDGMGGECAGEMAAYTAAAQLGKYYHKNRKQLRNQPELFLKNACCAMNGAVCGYGREHHIVAMGTTMAMLAFSEDSLYACNLGDSRIYMQRENLVQQVSEDHVWKGAFSLGKAPLTQFLGIEEEMKVEPAIRRLECEPGMRYLLCSDGITDLLAQGEMEEILRKSCDVGKTVELLRDAVLEKGARDNMTMVLCEIGAGLSPMQVRLLRLKNRMKVK